MVGMGLCGLDGMRPLAAQNLQKGRLRLFILSHERPWRMDGIRPESRDGLHYEDLLGGGAVYDVFPHRGEGRDAQDVRR